MSKSIVLIALIASVAFLMFESVSARCGRGDRGCCRKRIEYGRCHRHERRWAYNVTCGRCVQFDYSGCGGDENIFDNDEECRSCCHDTRPCPRYTLPRPLEGCEYRFENDLDSCPRPRLECRHRESHCRHDSCRIGERCLAEHRPCHGRNPCHQFQCVTDPCFAVSRHLRPCEKCISIPSPRCHHHPCPLIAHRENHCEEHRREEVLIVEEPRRRELVIVEEPRRHCPHFVPCERERNSCNHRRCPAFDGARCITDPCDCRKHWWVKPNGETCDDDQCNFPRHEFHHEFHHDRHHPRREFHHEFHHGREFHHHGRH